jgi:iron-sulfur cluster assembly accessory protein
MRPASLLQKGGNPPLGCDPIAFRFIQEKGRHKLCPMYNGRSIAQEFIYMVQLTERAVGKVKEIMAGQQPAPSGLRIAVVGGGCSGFSYSMAFENQPNMLDKTYQYDGLRVFIDQASLLYLDGAEVDYVETLEGAGFKFNNPQVKSTCGCGSSFQV